MKKLSALLFSLVTALSTVSLFSLSLLSFNAHAAVDLSKTSSVLDISLQSLNGRIAATIVFSDPVKVDVDLDQWLDIESNSGQKLVGSWVVGEKAKTLYFTNIEPENDYRITVKKELPLAGGQLLTQGKISSISVDPITPILGFAGNGNLLADSLTDGLPVVSVNVDNVDVDFYRIPEELLVSFLSNNTRKGQQEFWLLDSFIDKFELVYSGRFDLNLARNQTATSYLPVKNIAPLKQQGVYLAIMHKSGEYKYNYPSTWFAVSDLGIHLRVYADKSDVSVNSLATALPTVGVELSLLDSNGEVVASVKSDELGAASFNQKQIEQASLLIAKKDNDTSIVRLFGPVLDLSEFPVSGITEQAERLFFYSARDIYRPEEKITVSALLRNNDGKMVSPQVITFKLKQPDGRTVSEQRLSANTLGYYESTWQLPKGAATGQWSIDAYLSGQFHEKFQIQVEEFLPERMELTLEAADFVDLNNDFTVDINGKYLYGAPAANNTLQTELVTNTAPHPFKNYKDFYFSNPQITDYNRRKSLSDIKLDTKGNYSLTLENTWENAKTPIQLKVFNSLLDSGGRPVSRSISSYALPANQLIGIRPLFADDTAPYDGTANFEIILSDGETRLAANNLQVKLIRERRNYHWLYTDSEGWTSDYTEKHYTVSQKSLSVTKGNISSISLPVDWGYYRLEITNPVTKLVTGYKFRAGWSAEETVMAGRPDRVGLALNKQHYRVGDNVKVDIKPPAAGKGYLLVESDKALYRQAIDIPEEGKSVSFTMQEGWNSHNLYVSVLLIQPGDDRAEKLPRRMMGIIPLALNREDRKLNISLFHDDDKKDLDKGNLAGTTNLRKIRPNTQLKIPVQVSTNNQDQKLSGPVQVTLAAVDVGVLNISRYVTPDPFDGIFQQRAYSVSARDSYSDLIDADKGVMASLKFGGDSDVEQGGETDPDVQIVSLFSGTVEIDAQGRGEVVLDIPDFNGRLRLMAVAFNADSFGSIDQELEVASPVITQLTKARFLRAGDKSQLALDLNNLSGIDQQVELSMLLGDGLLFDDHVSKEKKSELDSDQINNQLRKMLITLKKGQKKSLYLPIVAGANYRTVDIDLTLANIITNDTISKNNIKKSPINLQRHWQLSIKPAWAITDKQWQEVLEEKEPFTLSKNEFSAMIPKDLEGYLNVSNKPPLDIASHFNALQAYPYGCLEQTTSGVFPQLYVNDDLLADLNIKGSDIESRRSSINIAIQRLQGMQRSNGGFGLWSDQGPEEHWLTVYVYDFLLRAQEAGYQVPVDNLEKVRKRVTAYLRSPNKISSYYENINSDTKFAVRAYAGQVLAQHNQAPLSILRYMYNDRSNSESPMALLQLSLAFKSAGDNQRATAAMDLALSRIEEFGENRIYYSSAVRDLALSAFWLLESKESVYSWQPLLLALIERLRDRQWLSTQERNALFLLGKELKNTEGQSMRLAWSLQGKAFDQELKRLSVSLSSQDLRDEITITNHGKDRVYLNLRASGYEKSAPKAMNNGLTVTRTFYRLNGDPVHEQESAKNTEIRSGDKLIVKLLVRADERLRHALLVDLLPAGLEIENQNLLDSFNQDDLRVEGESITDAMRHLDIANQEYRDDRFVMAVDLPKNREVAVYYLVRAVSPGIYQIPPTFAEDMYRPNIRHQGKNEGQLTVLPR